MRESAEHPAPDAIESAGFRLRWLLLALALGAWLLGLRTILRTEGPLELLRSMLDAWRP